MEDKKDLIGPVEAGEDSHLTPAVGGQAAFGRWWKRRGEVPSTLSRRFQAAGGRRLDRVLPRSLRCRRLFVKSAVKVVANFEHWGGGEEQLIAPPGQADANKSGHDRSFLSASNKACYTTPGNS